MDNSIRLQLPYSGGRGGGEGGGGEGGVWYGDEAMQLLANHVPPDLYTLMSHYLKQ